MPESRSSTPFFHDRDTKEIIELIARSSDLAIVAGAGVTIDRTGLNWRGFLNGLVLKAGLETDESFAIEEFGSRISDVEYASIVRSIYRQKGDWPTSLIADARDLLYSERSWRGGRYASAIAELTVSRLTHGLRTCILTTNHDTFLEAALREVATKRGVAIDIISPIIEVRETATPARVTDGDAVSARVDSASVATVIHLHGIIPRRDRRPDARVGSIVLGERDFFLWERRVNDLLVKIIRPATDVLLLGTGMSDPNILRPLHNLSTIRSQQDPGTATDSSVWYLATKVGLGRTAHIDDEVVSRHRVALSRRLGEFGAKAILPDTYAQAHQFLLELAQETNFGTVTKKYSDRDAPHRSGMRLRAWWDSWIADVVNGGRDDMIETDRQLATQTQHHVAILAALRKVKEVLATINGGLNPTDQIKVEVWVRWDPTEKSRRLRLWATSLGAWASEAGFKDEEISTTSPLASMRAFISGSATLDDVKTTPKRWARYLAIPIEVTRENEQSIVAGVVCVAVSRDQMLSWKNVQQMRTIVSELPQWVAECVEAGGFCVSRVQLPTSTPPS